MNLQRALLFRRLGSGARLLTCAERGSAQLLSSSVRRECDHIRRHESPDRAERLVASIRRAVPELKEKLPIRRVVVLFGSFAKGRAAAYGAVDLLVVCDGPSRGDAPATVGKTVSVRGTEPHVYTAIATWGRRKSTSTGLRMRVRMGIFLTQWGGPGPDRRRLTREVSVPRRLRFLVRPIGGTHSRYLFPIESCD